METIPTLLIFSSSIFIFFTTPAHSANPCQPVSCDGLLGPMIRFPFRLINRQPTHCGYPNFNLHCNSENQTMLNLPNSGNFTVDFIDYARQEILISDPNSCLPNRILNFSLSGSPFVGNNMRGYTLFNCSPSWRDYTFSHLVPLFCRSDQNYAVLAMDSHSAEVPATCRRIAHVRIPPELVVSMYSWSSVDVREDLQLVWREPDCVECEIRGGVCGFRGSGREIGCSTSTTLRNVFPRSAMYGIIIGLGVPGLICIIGLISYTCGMIKAMRARRRLNSELPITIVSDQHHPVIRSASGLDAPTIESYPMTVLGESRRLPKPSDATCAICLSDYEPKETLRTIPECSHFFHVDCIDEWLKLNGTCPLCRTSPESSATPSCSSRVSFSSSTSATTNGR